jgi:hypothetical protein
MKGTIRLLFLLCFPLHSFAEDAWWSIEPLRTGSALNFNTNLSIEQSGFAELSFDAEYETHPFEDAPYYGWRVSRRNSKGAWEIEFLHHKVYLQNNPPEVNHFEVSHGYNMLFINYAWTYKALHLRAGGGPVISHAESEIRGISFHSGYELSGFCGQASIEKRFYVSNRFFFAIEGKFTAAKATVSVADGEASVPNFAVHGLIGFGFDL